MVAEEHMRLVAEERTRLAHCALPAVSVVWLPAVLVLASLSCCDAKPAGPPAAQAPPRRVGEFLGGEAVRVLSAPTKVQTFRLVSRVEGPAADGADAAPPGAPSTAPAELHGYRVAAAGLDQGAAFGARVAAVLFDPHSYQFDSAKGCIFDPGVAFRVWRGDEHVDVVVCFTCSEFRLYVPEPEKKVRRLGEDFDENRAAFVRLAKDAFPGDPQIQGLR
jgi:hypothetical protein